MKATGGRTPAPSAALSAASSSSASSLEGRQGTRPATSHQRRNRSGQRKLKEACLDRDNNRCVVSGLYDVKRAEELPEEEYNEHPKANTECAHVIPFSASAESPDGNIDPEKVVATWFILYSHLTYFSTARGSCEELGLRLPILSRSCG